MGKRRGRDGCGSFQQRPSARGKNIKPSHFTGLGLLSPVRRFALTEIFTDRRLCIRKHGRESGSRSRHHHDQIESVLVLPIRGWRPTAKELNDADWLIAITDHAVLIRTTHANPRQPLLRLADCAAKRPRETKRRYLMLPCDACSPADDA